MSKSDLGNLTNIEEIYSMFFNTGLLDCIDFKKHTFVCGQIGLLSFFCLEKNINIEDKLYSMLLHSTLRICRVYEEDINFNNLLIFYKETIKKNGTPTNPYSWFDYEVELIDIISRLYLKSKIQKRLVLIEKCWEYHIGSKNYWNNKLIKYEQTIN